MAAIAEINAPSLGEQLAALFHPTVTDFPALKVSGVDCESYSIEVPNQVYHSDRTGVSCSQLKNLLQSPAHFNAAMNALRKASTGPQTLGTALHTAVLEPHLLTSSTAVWDGGTRTGAKWKEFATLHHGKIIFTPAEMKTVIGMRDAVNNYQIEGHQGVTLGDLIAKGESEKTIYWRDQETGIMCKIRVDCLLNPIISFDLKTVGDARLDGFLKTQALKLDYDFEAAMYFCGVKAFTGLDLPFCFIPVETDEPHGVQLHETGPGSQFFENGMRKFHYALRTLKTCRETGVWPGYQRTYHRLDEIPQYAVFQAPDGHEWS